MPTKMRFCGADCEYLRGDTCACDRGCPYDDNPDDGWIAELGWERENERALEDDGRAAVYPY